MKIKDIKEYIKPFAMCEVIVRVGYIDWETEEYQVSTVTLEDLMLDWVQEYPQRWICPNSQSRVLEVTLFIDSKVEKSAVPVVPILLHKGEWCTFDNLMHQFSDFKGLAIAKLKGADEQ